MASTGFDEDVIAATVEITGGQVFGTGFFIAPDRILTCAHVIEDILRTSSVVMIAHRDRRFEVGREHVHLFSDEDVAVIDSRFDAPSYLRLDPALRIGDELYAFGYTREFAAGDSLTLEYEGPTRGTEPLLKLKGGLVQRRTSGAPLY